MPEYLAPGVYVEETSYRSKSVEGVSTSTAGFIGPTRFGPMRGTPEIITSLADFIRIYGDLEQLDLGKGRTDNYLAHAVRAFFAEGGSRLYVMRVYKRGDTDGHAEATLSIGSQAAVKLRARYPGAHGNFHATMTFKFSPNVAVTVKNGATSQVVLQGVKRYDTLWVGNPAQPGGGTFYFVDHDPATNEVRLKTSATDAGVAVSASVTAASIVTASVDVAWINRKGKVENQTGWGGLALYGAHPNSLESYFKAHPEARAVALYVPLIITLNWGTLTAGLKVDLAAQTKVKDDKAVPKTIDEIGKLSYTQGLVGGSDGVYPGAAEYGGEEGKENGQPWKSGLLAFEDVDDIAIVAAPAAASPGMDATALEAITRLLLVHCENMRYRVAVMDPPRNQLVGDIRTYRSKYDSKYGALYYPWVQIMDPVTEEPIFLPPSGFVAGIYARNDAQTGVHKAPANEVVRMAMGFELTLNKAQQDVLNPEGINCFRTFRESGNRLWGARTVSSDPEWKYVSVRRYMCYLENSIEKGTQWAVFMNNDENLWGNIERTISDFLFNEWKNARLFGSAPGEAYFVKCDRTTMTQNDLDNGRLICLVGVSPVRPAEFVIFRIGQWTADA